MIKLKQLIRTLFTSKTDKTWIQLFRYGIVGGTALAVDWGTLAFLTEICGINYLISGGIAFILGLTVNYLLSIRWVFDVRNVEQPVLELLIFAVIGVIGLGINELILWLFTEKVGIYYMQSKMISAGIVFFWNFIARKLILFRRVNHEET